MQFTLGGIWLKRKLTIFIMDLLVRTTLVTPKQILNNQFPVQKNACTPCKKIPTRRLSLNTPEQSVWYLFVMIVEVKPKDTYVKRTSQKSYNCTIKIK